MADLALLDITTDQHTEANAWQETLGFAERFRLTSYNAAYLELAVRRALPLATLDGDLRTAGQAMGILLLGGE